MTDASLQERYAPNSRCFGCGPANEQGLRIGSRLAGDELVADWTPQPHHEAFDNILNGGIIGTLLDCHSNWTAAMHLMDARGATRPPSCVTSEYAIRLLRPTPTSGPLRLRAHVVDAGADRATVEAEIVAGGQTTATCRGTFVAVGPGHPAYERW
ncbi:MAG TPA: PaaI family thioesterase [Candidatus Limnocylindrales bacterium]